MKKTTIAALFGLVIIAGVAAGIYVQSLENPDTGTSVSSSSSSSSTSYATSSQASEPMFDWVTYKNDEYGFEFRHPKNVTEKAETNAEFSRTFNLSFTGGTLMTEKKMTVVIQKNKTEQTCYVQTGLEGPMTVNGVDFKYIPGFKWDHAMGGLSSFASDYVTLHGTDCVTIGFRMALRDETGFSDNATKKPEPSATDLDTTVFDSMLASFRFTK